VAGTTGIGGERRPSTDGSSKRTAGRYVLGDLLGRGGMAEVFAGHSMGDHGFQKPVAIKRLLPELASDHVFVERLIEEAKLLVGMQHGNIVSVIDLARDGDDVFLVMEFVDGPSLRQLLKARGSRGLSLGIATYIVQSAAAGLEFAHNRPGGAIIHADISPSNLLLTTSGEVRVADFGIARREGGGYGVVEGKWAYMAPEQARGEPLTPRADVFALGVVLYELICGAHPLGRQVTHEQRDSSPMRVIPPRVIKPSIPPGLDAICMRALAHDPRDRYKSMQALIDAIVEERFTNHYREAASDLAQAIRNDNPVTNQFATNPRTQVTDRPVTIMTRSLLRELTPVRRSPVPSSTPSAYVAPAAHAMPAPHETDVSYTPRGERRSRSSSESGRESWSEIQRDSRSVIQRDSRSVIQRDSRSELSRSESLYERPSSSVPPLGESGARTNMVAVDDVARAMLEVPPIFRADGTPLPPFTFAAASPMLPGGQDLASVVGGHTMTGHQVAAEPVRSNRGTIAVLAIAALIGIGAAVAFQLKPSERELAAVEPDPRDNDREARKELAPPPVQAPVTEPVARPTLPPTLPQEEAPRQETTSQESAKLEPSPASGDGKDARSTRDAKAVARSTPTPPPGDTRRAPEVPSGASRTSTPVASISRNAPKKEPGILRVHTTPWSMVSIGNEKQEAPGAKFKLAPGHYTIRLNFPTLGITETRHVTIESTRTFMLNINKEDEE
jgi:serine/threonine protein kinase